MAQPQQAISIVLPTTVWVRLYPGFKPSSSYYVQHTALERGFFFWTLSESLRQPQGLNHISQLEPEPCLRRSRQGAPFLTTNNGRDSKKKVVGGSFFITSITSITTSTTSTTFTTIHHPSPPFTTIHHHSPPFTTIHHQLHHHSPPFTDT
ncbi:hypothetical protein L249_8886 [Ophiocordyceps polyrhachis-furcata BCC 54312]|uniref:Uncharacterized protein n=1 Tax=Ophiocordyceps polyrhachis-furcata BCC 54312 TaxID=1330021 RepID=A0A367L1X3_9HYPO|nr:hypothetical protein L249_8886 [Ophiocordyceps polyrhachis-furcata BCC 54312]